MGADLGAGTQADDHHPIRPDRFVSTSSKIGSQLQSLCTSAADRRVRSHRAVSAEERANHSDDRLSEVRRARGQSNGPGASQRQRAEAAFCRPTGFSQWNSRGCLKQFDSGFGDARTSQSDDSSLSDTFDRLSCTTDLWFSGLWLHSIQHNLERTGNDCSAPGDVRSAVCSTASRHGSDRPDLISNHRTDLSARLCWHGYTDPATQRSTVDAPLPCCQLSTLYVCSSTTTEWLPTGRLPASRLPTSSLRLSTSK